MEQEWVMPAWMEQYRDIIEDREVTKTTAELAMSDRVGAPSWDIVRTRILFLYSIQNLAVRDIFP